MAGDATQMSETTVPVPAPGSPVPEPWRAELAQRLGEGEHLLAWLEIDLDGRLRFGRGLVAVTDRRIAARLPGEVAWHDWALRDGLTLRKRDHAGVGMLELLDPTRRLDSWRFTLGHDAAAQRLIEAFELGQLALSSGTAATAPPARCPRSSRCEQRAPTTRSRRRWVASSRARAANSSSPTRAAS